MKYLILFICYALLLPLKAQETITYSNTKVGDILSDLELNKIDNYSQSNIKLSELNQKLIIFDFWATWCGPCVAKIPLMDSIMKALPNDMLFLSVSDEPKEKVQSFLEKKEKDMGTKLIIPSIADDNNLSKLFPHYFVPHYVWIKLPERKVIAITRGEEIDFEKIKSVLVNFENAKSIPKKIDKVLDYQNSEPLLPYIVQNDSIRTNGVNQYSFFTGYIPDLTGGMYTTFDRQEFKNDKSIRVVMKNVSIDMLVAWAFGKGKRFFQDASKILDVKEPAKISPNNSPEKYRDWRIKNSHCYEIKTHKSNKDIIFDLMQKDIEEYFVDYKFCIEERVMDCMVLISTGDNKIIKSKGGESKMSPSPLLYQVQNVPMEDLIITLQFYHHLASPFIIVDKSGIDFNIDMDIQPKSFKDFEEINKQLKKYNLKFIRKSEKVEVIVFKDR